MDGWIKKSGCNRKVEKMGGRQKGRENTERERKYEKKDVR